MNARAQHGGGERAGAVAAPAAAYSFILGGVSSPAVATSEHLSGRGCLPCFDRSVWRPKQPACVVRWLFATAVPARIVRWPFPEVKPSPSWVLDVRGSRASTDPCALPNLFKLPEVPTMEKPAPCPVAPRAEIPSPPVRVHSARMVSRNVA